MVQNAVFVTFTWLQSTRCSWLHLVCQRQRASVRSRTDLERVLQVKAVKEAEEKADKELDVLLSDLSGLLDEHVRKLRR